MAGRARTKQHLVDEICVLLELQPVEQSAGSTIPKAFYREVASALGVHLASSKTGISAAQAIVAAAGLEWPPGADSVATPSGGGGTITARGLAAVRDAAIRLKGDQVMDAVAQGANGDEVAEVRPGVHSLKIYENFNNEWWFALAELVDNSIASYERLVQQFPDVNLPQLRVEIQLSDSEVVVRDNAGGIDGKNLRRALQVGTRPEDLTKLNQYGIGMKTSVFWIGKSVSIVTSERNSSVERSLHLDLTEIHSDHDTVPIKRGMAIHEEHGTTISITKLARGRPQTTTLTKTRAHLASIYRKYLVPEAIVITINGERVEFKPLSIVYSPLWRVTELEGKAPSDEPARLWREEFEVIIPANLDTSGNPRDRTVTGWAGIFEWGPRKAGKRGLAGIQGFWKNRLVLGLSGGGQTVTDDDAAWKPKELQLDGSFPPSLRLTGEVVLDDFTVGTHKNSINWNREQQSHLWKAVRKKLEAADFWTMMENYSPSGERKRPTKNPRGAPAPPPEPLPPISPPGPRMPVPPGGSPGPEQEPGATRRDVSTVHWTDGATTRIRLENRREATDYLLEFQDIDVAGRAFTAYVNEASRYVRTFHPSPESLEEVETVSAAFAHAQLWLRLSHEDGAELAHTFHQFFEYALNSICKAHELRGRNG